MVPCIRRILRWAMFGFACPFLSIASGAAQDNVDCRSLEADTQNPQMVDWLGDVYRQRAHSSAIIDHQLKNGVTWRLETDASSSLALPRITWMADPEAMEKANRLLDAAHGCLMAEYAWWAGYWYSMAKSESGKGHGVFAPRSHFISQPDPELIELTYASSRLVSFYHVHVHASDGNAYYIRPAGWVLDLAKGTVHTAQPCGPEGTSESSNGLFRLADFLDVCTPEAKARFLAVWSSKIEAIKKTPAFEKDPYFGDCQGEMGKLDDWQDESSLHLTAAGLAVYDGAFLPGWPKRCLGKKSSINPVIIPYRELEPFMKPGPWRDELLKSGG
jgi:hypothetical protein